MKLKLDEKEEEEIGKIARNFRPKVLDSEEMKYSLNPEEKMILFVNAFNFIANIKNSSDSNIKNKISFIITKLKESYIESLILVQSFKEESVYCQYKIRKKMQKILLKNSEEIDHLLILVNKLGKRVQMFDPDEHGGVYD